MVSNYILLRETLDWHRAHYNDLRDDAIRNAATLWDSTFPVTYLQCRAAIKALSLELLGHIHNVTVLPPNAAESLVLQDDDILLIADDDDWYHPDIFTLLRQSDITRHGAALWPDALLGYHVRWQAATDRLESHILQPKLRPLQDDKAFSPVKTNNYAITGRFLREVGCNISAVQSHVAAAETLTAYIQHVTRLTETLSIVNRHPCSYLVLVEGLEPKDAETLQDLVRGYASNMTGNALPNALQWVRPAVHAMQSIFAFAL